MRRFHSEISTSERDGAVLILVLVVVMLLSFSLYSFSERMLLQYQATSASLRQMQLRNHAESGVAAVSDLLINHQRNANSATAASFDKLFRVPVSSERGNFSGFSILQEIPQQGEEARHGIIDEASRLNLNSLPLDSELRNQTRERLTKIPRMTSDIAAAILDWMDADDEVSQFGAESQWYLAQQPSYRPRQNRFRSLSELILVRGVTAELLYGEDRNRNGVPDYGEDANRDGRVDFGWSRWLTVLSYERLTHRNGDSKINLNDSNLAELYDAVKAQLGQDEAKFIVAMRMRGPMRDETERVEELTEEDKIDERFASAQRRLAQQLGSGKAQGLDALKASGSIRTEVRDGITLPSNAAFQFRSIFDLIGVRTRINIDNVDTVLTSPWTESSNSLEQTVSELRNRFVCFAGDRVPARINVFEADREVLMTIPDVSESIATSIVAARSSLSGGLPWKNEQNLAWFALRGVLSVKQLQELGPFITSGSDVFRGVALGHSSQMPSGIAIQFAVDVTDRTPAVVSWNELAPLPVDGLVSEHK